MIRAFFRAFKPWEKRWEAQKRALREKITPGREGAEGRDREGGGGHDGDTYTQSHSAESSILKLNVYHLKQARGQGNQLALPCESHGARVAVDDYC